RAMRTTISLLKGDMPELSAAGPPSGLIVTCLSLAVLFLSARYDAGRSPLSVRGQSLRRMTGGTTFAWKCVILGALVQISGTTVAAQDRPLIEPLRIGYAQSEAIGERMRERTSLERTLWQKGFSPVWRVYPDGLAAVRALDAGEIDITLAV